VLDFAKVLLGPDHGAELTSPAGLERVMRTGLAEPADLKPEVLAAVVEPFRTEEARRALALAGVGLRRPGFAEIARALPELRVPVHMIYGELDRLLPDVAQTMARIKREVPHAEITRLRGRGHFIQEESPQEVGELLAAFFAT
jgi:pimeloyl-ACP methyl ester carboxylesterase